MYTYACAYTYTDTYIYIYIYIDHIFPTQVTTTYNWDHGHSSAQDLQEDDESSESDSNSEEDAQRRSLLEAGVIQWNFSWISPKTMVIFRIERRIPGRVFESIWYRGEIVLGIIPPASKGHLDYLESPRMGGITSKSSLDNLFLFLLFYLAGGLEHVLFSICSIYWESSLSQTIPNYPKLTISISYLSEG